MPIDPTVALSDVTFRYESASAPLFHGLTARFPPGFTGIVGANGVGKSTLLRLVTGALIPDTGTVFRGADAICCDGADAIYCDQRTDFPPPGSEAFLQAADPAACALQGRFGVEADFLSRWNTLSHGERKRLQIAQALWCGPAVLAIDEPTNHIDAPARRLLVDGLRRFRGVGLIVSHDRDLLDALCQQCLWLEPPNAIMVPGGFTNARAHMASTRASAVRDRAAAVRERDRLAREIVKRREQASRAHRDRSKRGLAPKDSSGRAAIDLARVSGKDGQAGRRLRQLDGRAARADARLAAARVDKVHDVGIWLPESRSRRDTLFLLEPGEVGLGGGRVLRFPQLLMQPQDRVAIVGPNGAGKTTLLAHIARFVNVPAQHLTTMPQEVDARMAQVLLDETRALPRQQLGLVMNGVSRLGSRPERLLASRQPSPGEIRKLLLALGIARAPHLIVLDEPTNHLDLPSIEALEQALAECPCGLLVVSHDQRFLDRLVNRIWRIQPDGGGDSQVIVEWP